MLFLAPATLLSYFDSGLKSAIKLQERLIETGPIVPVKSMLNSIEKSEYPNLIQEIDRELYRRFFSFSDFINNIYENSPWRLQEINNANIPDPDYPTFGPRFMIYYNQVQVGDLDISAHPEFKSKNPICSMNLELRHIRLLPFGQVRSFVCTLCTYVTWDDNREFEKTIDQMLMEALWELGFHDSVNHCATGRFQGSCKHFIKDKS